MTTDTRRAPRRQVNEPVAVLDRMTETTIGQIGNVSESGMLLIARAALTEDALYQVTFAIPDDSGRDVHIEAGMHLLWIDPPHASGQAWAGFRLLTLSPEHREVLRKWIERGLPAT